MAYISYIDIPVSDLEQARKFYAKIFGWTIEKVPGLDYMTFEASFQPNGGFILTNDIPEWGITPYITVQDIDKVLDQVLDLGGRIKMNKTLLSEAGDYKAEIIDIFGNRLALYCAPEEVAGEKPKNKDAKKAKKGKKKK